MRGDKQKKHKRYMPHNMAMTMACVLLCLTLLSTHLTGGLYAKYTTGTSAEDGARAAKFGRLSVTEQGDFTQGKAIFIPGVNLEKDINITYSGGETDVYVFAAVEAPNWQTTDSGKKAFADRYCSLMSWNVDAGWNYLPTSDGRYVYWQYVDAQNTFEDNFIAENTITVSENITKQQIAAMTGIEINLQAYVVQAGGFAGAGAAWASLTA